MTPFATPVRRTSPTYTRRYKNMTATCVLAALVLMSIGTIGGESGDLGDAPSVRGTGDDVIVERTGPGTWGTTEPGPANATWLVIGQTVHAFVVHQDGRHFACYLSSGDRNDTLQSPICSAESKEGGTIDLEWRGNDTLWRGSFAAQHTMILLDIAADEPPFIPGFIVILIGAILIIIASVCAYLFIQERRISRYLVRRLYEETKGRMPPDWPKHLRQQWIARAFIRGKN